MAVVVTVCVSDVVGVEVCVIVIVEVNVVVGVLVTVDVAVVVGVVVAVVVGVENEQSAKVPSPYDSIAALTCSTISSHPSSMITNPPAAQCTLAAGAAPKPETINPISAGRSQLGRGSRTYDGEPVEVLQTASVAGFPVQSAVTKLRAVVWAEHRSSGTTRYVLSLKV